MMSALHWRIYLERVQLADTQGLYNIVWVSLHSWDEIT